MLKLIPTMATLTNKHELKESSGGKKYSKVCFAIDDTYYWCALFSATAEYIDSFANVGAQVFIEDWCIKQNTKDGKTYHDIIVNKTRIVKNKEA